MLDYKNVSLANQVYERIEYDILSGVYAAGEVISEARLSEELGVSRTPIREAMARLESDHLIGDSPQGTIVIGITEKDIADMFEIKLRLETVATRWAVENITPAEVEKLKDILDQQEFYASKGNVNKVRDLDTEFHDVIYSVCGSVVFATLLSGIHRKLLRYRKASLEKGSRINHSIKEHKQVLDAIIAGNGEEAERQILNHINKVYEGVIASHQG